MVRLQKIHCDKLVICEPALCEGETHPVRCSGSRVAIQGEFWQVLLDFGSIFAKNVGSKGNRYKYAQETEDFNRLIFIEVDMLRGSRAPPRVLPLVPEDRRILPLKSLPRFTTLQESDFLLNM